MEPSTSYDHSPEFNHTILFLSLCLLVLVLLLVFMYRRLNKETDGEYAIRRMVYKEGGIRDQVQRAALGVGTCLGIQLWPRSDTEEDGEEMREIHDEEGRVDEGGSQGSDCEGSGQGEEEEEEDDGRDDDDDVEQCDESQEKGDDTSNDTSSLKTSGAGEQTRLPDQPEANKETEITREEKEEEVAGRGEASGGSGLLIDLKQFSGSATWSAEKGVEVIESDVTLL